jgi:hypothetical protein
MSPFEYFLIILFCLPVFVALDKNMLKLALILSAILLLFVMLVALLPNLDWLFKFKWIVWFGELYFLRRVLKKS